MVDVFLDHQFYEQDDVDVARSLEHALVVPAGIIPLEHGADAVVLAQEQRVDCRGECCGIGAFSPEREQRRAFFDRPIAWQMRRLWHERECRIPHASSIVERWCPLALARVDGLELALLARQLAASPQYRRDGRIQPVELGQVDLMVGAGAPAVRVRHQEPVREPLRETREQQSGAVGEHRRPLRAQLEQAGHLRRRWQHILRRGRQIAAEPGPVGQRRPVRIRCLRAQRQRPARRLQHGNVDDQTVGDPSQPISPVNKRPKWPEAAKHRGFDGVTQSVAARVPLLARCLH